VSFILDLSLLQTYWANFANLKSPSLWFRVQLMGSHYPQYDAAAAYNGLYGTASGQPLNQYFKGLIIVKPPLGTYPTYNDNVVPVLSTPAPSDPNMLSLVPLSDKGNAPPPELKINFVFIMKENENGVNLPYV
jgi:hypothetical protein